MLVFHSALLEAYSLFRAVRHAVLVGQSESDISGRSPRELHVVAAAERERGSPEIESASRLDGSLSPYLLLSSTEVCDVRSSLA